MVRFLTQGLPGRVSYLLFSIFKLPQEGTVIFLTLIGIYH